MKLTKYIFRSRLKFAPVDPLGDGLREMIQEEQHEPDAIHLEDAEIDTATFWQHVEFDEPA